MAQKEELVKKNNLATLYIKIVVAIRINPMLVSEYVEKHLSETVLGMLEDNNIVYEHKTFGEFARTIKTNLDNNYKIV